MKRIAHYVGFSRNYGDLAIQYSMMELLKDAWGKRNGNMLSREELEFFPIDLKAGKVINKDSVEFINNNCDLFVLGGGGLIMPGDGFQTASGWQFNITKDALNAIDIPIIGYALGYNIFPYDKPLPSNAVKHIQNTVNKCTMFSCRDDGSAQELENMGVKNVRVVPDPAMFCPYKSLKLPLLDRYKIRIGFSWAGDREKNRFGGATTYEQLLPIVRRLKTFVDDTDGIVTYIPHVERYDMEVIKTLELELKDRFFDISKYIPWMWPEHYLYAPYFVGLYKKMDIVVGMRGHSNIIPVGLGIPTIALGKHSKNKYFADMMGIPTINDGDDAKLLDLLYDMKANGVSSPTTKKVEQLKRKLSAFNKDVLNADSGRFFKPNSNLLGS